MTFKNISVRKKKPNLNAYFEIYNNLMFVNVTIFKTN